MKNVNFQGSSERYHAFDALRATMMILGVALHSATCYSTYPGVWWVKDPATSVSADVFLIFLHAFRLPAFFVMSGFFAALLVAKRGWQGFLENRAARLGLPFILCMLVCYPLLKFGSGYGYFVQRQAGALEVAWRWFTDGRLEREIEPMHLWFLETLMLCSMAALAVQPWLERVLRGEWFGRLITSRWAVVALAPLTGLTLLTTEFGVLDTPHSFAPNWHVVLAYAVFFAVGWGLYLHRGRLEEMRRGGWGLVGLALVTGLAMCWGLDRQASDRAVKHLPEFVITALAAGATAWLMILGLMRVYLRKASEPAPVVRHLSDSAYWLYLMHPAVLLAVQIPMMKLGWPAEAKMVAGFLLAMPVLLWTYDRWVRPTWVGVVLNGRRYASGWPATAPAARLDTMAES